VVSFDHDLAFEHYVVAEDRPGADVPYATYKEKTGLDAAKWLVEYCKLKGVEFPAYVVHSMNPVGRQNIINCIEDFNKVR
jgi:hypothetical protein